MRPSVRLLVRILPREALPAHSLVKPPLAAHVPRTEQPTVVDRLLARKAAAESSGTLWPANLRVEKILDRSEWRDVPRTTIKALKKAMKER